MATPDRKGESARAYIRWNILKDEWTGALDVKFCDRRFSIARMCLLHMYVCICLSFFPYWYFVIFRQRHCHRTKAFHAIKWAATFCISYHIFSHQHMQCALITPFVLWQNGQQYCSHGAHMLPFCCNLNRYQAENPISLLTRNNSSSSGGGGVGVAVTR